MELFVSENVPFWNSGEPHLPRVRPGRRGRPPRYREQPVVYFVTRSVPLTNFYEPTPPPEQLYTSATQPRPRAQHALLSFPMRLVTGRQKLDFLQTGVTDALFMSSRDGLVVEPGLRRSLAPVLHRGHQLDPRRLHALCRDSRAGTRRVFHLRVPAR